ncbi:hypothetical protein KL921_001001 [Ogataea angusta]|uniref:Nascent polypeptide-associated complex subunit beta n=2 Tax=Ogataea TaxID=461281 RepID=W1QCA8_OGAPD|nr:Subunit beta1 of the nascent polypeptide-associated complex (NAC) involved in protein targeting [Ogataea parapolymorpha DL-1]XP_043061628.1 uncharacterized protein KL928_001169 [Ogataea angusta]KAG7869406.1 hypothetical protein KL918_000951 [Ogataea parapolymorpha]ESW97342.1 Subunit beta1 of the nascent polypeptide-associated complex (NAC) involved in protein targeting [Ogataea parapolymorpha DL-1]KAG7813455.1 hypothetical protein KL921_001001 [Ogataea angusta]KAG7821085.1 hypothetical prot
MPIDPEKLAKLQKASAKKVGGQRIKAKKVNKSAEADDTQLQNTLKKLNAEVLTGIEEANFFKEDGKVLHFNRVGVQAAAAYNTYTFSGFAQEKTLPELIPNILPQLGAENLSMLQKLAEQFQGSQAGAAPAAKEEEDVPELTEGETFENDVE